MSPSRAILLIAIAIGVSTPASIANATCYFLECDDDAPKQSPPSPGPSPTDPPAVTPQPPQPHTRNTSYWNHNGSVVYLIATGNKREFYYSQPRPGMVAQGVTPGTLLFTGYVSGSGYRGTAFLFSARCGPRSYAVSGKVQETGGRVIMTGNATNVNSRCEISNTINDVLVFQYLYSD